MARKEKGNEREVLKFLLNNIGTIKLNHIGLLEKIELPFSKKKIEISSIDQINEFFSDDATKKADVYLNEFGVSIKQQGPANLFNRLQRKNIIQSFEKIIGRQQCINIQRNLDNYVNKFHLGEIKRDVPVGQIFFDDNDFKKILNFLMLDGSPNLGISSFPASHILIAPKKVEESSAIQVFDFKSFFETYSTNIFASIRRSWFGQESQSEHERAKQIMADKENLPWVFDDVSGSPREHKTTKKAWRDEVLPTDRKTVYYVMLQLIY